QRRRPYAESLVIWQEPDVEGRQSHQHQGPDQHRFAAEPISKVSQHDPAERPSDEADREGSERGQRSCETGHSRKKLRTEDDGCSSSVNEEVVPLDGCTDRACKRDAARFGRGREDLAGNRDSRPLFSAPAFVSRRATLLHPSAAWPYRDRYESSSR